MKSIVLVDNSNVWREGQAASARLAFGQDEISQDRPIVADWVLNFPELLNVIQTELSIKDFLRKIVFSQDQSEKINFDPFEFESAARSGGVDSALHSYVDELVSKRKLGSGDQVVIVSGKSSHIDFVKEIKAKYSLKVLVVFWSTAAEDLKSSADKFVSLDPYIDGLRYIKDKRDQSESSVIQERRKKLSGLKSSGWAFPNSFRRKNLSEKVQRDYEKCTKEELENRKIKVSLAGRLMANRAPFYVLQDTTGRIQFYADKQTQKEIKSWDVGDIVGVEGILHRSGKGDLYVLIDRYELLTKSLRPLPEKYHGLQDQETRYRQRYIDLIMNEETRRTFRIRSQLIDGIRDYLTDLDFLEVETPMMQAIPGGASAKPFVTFHNALDLEMFLRISPELYLKRLVVGGLERVFEINRNFRNEGLSTRHNPEFTMIEFYQAYADYKDLMDLTEDMLRFLANRILGKTLLDYQGKKIDFGAPFLRISVFDSILHFNPDIKAEQLRTMEGAKEIAKRLNIHLKDTWGLGKVQIEIFDATVEHRLEQPTFITQYPTEVSPLARRNDNDPFVTDRFEFFIGGREIANGFSELNDAEDQAERFQAQVLEKEAGDDEAMYYDADYVTALEYGLPPTAGEGIGIDRLVMLFTDSPSIRDVLLFPHMRPL